MRRRLVVPGTARPGTRPRPARSHHVHRTHLCRHARRPVVPGRRPPPDGRGGRPRRGDRILLPSVCLVEITYLVEKGRLEYKIEWVGEEAHRRIEQAAALLGVQWLKPLREALPESITAEQIRLVVAYMRRRA